MDDVDELIACYARRGDLCRDGETVTALQHAWQCGRLAAGAGADGALLLAAWLHDVGRLLPRPVGEPSPAEDDHHESHGAQALKRLFGPTVAMPVALHVQAKRCLVALRPAYIERMSTAARLGLARQGGPMTADERRVFLALPQANAALQLRLWDDLARYPDWQPASPADALAELRALAEAYRLRERDAETA